MPECRRPAPAAARRGACFRNQCELSGLQPRPASVWWCPQGAAVPAPPRQGLGRRVGRGPRAPWAVRAVRAIVRCAVEHPRPPSARRGPGRGRGSVVGSFQRCKLAFADQRKLDLAAARCRGKTVRVQAPAQPPGSSAASRLKALPWLGGLQRCNACPLTPTRSATDPATRLGLDRLAAGSAFGQPRG